MQHTFARLGRLLFGVYATLTFAAVTLVSVILLALTPGLVRRRRIVRGTARSVFHLTRTRLVISGLSHIPAQPCIIVANHASYLDGPILTAALPAALRLGTGGWAEDGGLRVQCARARDGRALGERRVHLQARAIELPVRGPMRGSDPVMGAK